MTLQHQANEFHQNANCQRARRWANDYLAEMQTSDDPMWRQHLQNLYMNALRIGHKMHEEGSLLVSVEAVQ